MKFSTWPEQVLFMRHPDGLWFVGWGSLTWQATMPEAKPAFFLPDFFLSEEKPWCVPSEFTRIGDRELRDFLSSFAAAQPAWEWRPPERTGFTRQVDSIQELIRRGELSKAVPVIFESARKAPDADQRMALWRAAASSHHRFVAYGGWWGDEGLVGLSPEILFFSQPGFVESMALAGTAPVDGPSLLESRKDQHEHQLVVEDLRLRLGRLGTVKVVPTREWPIGMMKHLRTDLAVASDAGFMELVELLHPTPALGAAPRERAWTWLRDQSEAKHRRRFGAPFGLHVPGEFDLGVVAIRNLQWDKDQVLLGSGCGIVADSEVDKEWAELALKRASVKKLLGLM